MSTLTSATDQLGGRLPLLDPSALSPAAKALYHTIDSTIIPKARQAGFRAKLADGRLIGPFNALLQSPEIGTGYLAYSGVEAQNSSLDERTRQLVMLAVGAVWQSAYEVYAHAAHAQKAGFSDLAIQEASNGRIAPELSAREQLAYRFAYELTSQRRVEASLYQQTAAAFGPVGIVDLVLLIGRYHMTCVLLNGFEIPAP